MYVTAPRWRGTSVVSRLRSPLQIRMDAGGRRGLGAVDPCNWTDEFGQCITPGPGDTVVTPGGLRLRIPAGSTPAPKPPAGGGATDWLNQNAGTLAMVGGGALLLAFVAKAVSR